MQHEIDAALYATAHFRIMLKEAQIRLHDKREELRSRAGHVDTIKTELRSLEGQMDQVRVDVQRLNVECRHRLNEYLRAKDNEQMLSLHNA